MFVAIIPLTKIPLNARPIVSTIEVILGLHQQTVSDSSGLVGRSMYFRGIMKIAIRILIVVVFLIISIIFPAFDSIMAFMGSALCFTICVTYVFPCSLLFQHRPFFADSISRLRLPIAFYLKLFQDEIPPREKLIATSIMILSTCLSVTGTIWAFLPKSLIGAEPLHE